VRGQMVVEQAGREAALEAGDFTVVDWSRPARWATASERAVSLMFPRALLALPHDQVARLGGVRISGRHGTGALFSSFARQVAAHLDDYGVADGARLGTTVADLLDHLLHRAPTATRGAPACMARRWDIQATGFRRSIGSATVPAMRRAAETTTPESVPAR
jgi:hypothetical protein